MLDCHWLIMINAIQSNFRKYNHSTWGELYRSMLKFTLKCCGFLLHLAWFIGTALFVVVVVVLYPLNEVRADETSLHDRLSLLVCRWTDVWSEQTPDNSVSLSVCLSICCWRRSSSSVSLCVLQSQ